MKVIAMYLPQFHEVEENNRFRQWNDKVVYMCVVLK